MALWTEQISPAELTGFGRQVSEDYDNDITAEVLPSQFVDDVVFTFSVNGKLNETAQYRAFDAETAIGKNGDAEEKTARLLPVGLKKRFSEYDQLRRRSAASPESVQAAADRLAAEVSRATVDRVRLLRAEALVTGGLSINENGVHQNVDFGRRADFTTSADVFWNQDGDAIADLEAYRNAFVDENGIEPTHIIASTRVFAALSRSETVRAYLGSDAGIMSREAINSVMSNYGLPQLTINDARVGGQRLIADDKLLMVVAGQAGSTVWGTTVEADDPRYGLAAADLPGLVVGAYQEDDPNTKWIRANAIALPILAESNLTFASTVLAPATP